MNRLSVFILIAAIGQGFFGQSIARTIKLATLAPEGTPYHDILQELGERWHKLSDGKHELRIYAGGIAGDEGDMVRKMRIGQIHAAAITGGGLADIVSDIRAFQLPMMFRTLDELDYVREQMAKRLASAFRDKGFELLTWGDAGWVYFFTQSPVVHPNDLKPLKLQVWVGNTTMVEAWKDLGFQPVPITVTEIHLSLASRLINAILVPPYAALSFQWFGQAKHMTQLKIAPLVGALVMSNRGWRAIGKDLKPAFRHAAEDAGRKIQQARKLEVKAINVMKNYGLVVHPVPQDVVRAWEAVGRRTYSHFVGRVVSADMVKTVERIRDEYRRNNARK